jgi:hypothetical protein
MILSVMRHRQLPLHSVSHSVQKLHGQAEIVMGASEVVVYLLHGAVEW